MAIAGQAWIGRATGHVVLIERIHDAVLKLLLNVHQVKRNIEHARDAPGVVDRLQGAALILGDALNAIVLRLDHAGFRPQAQHNADDHVPLFLE